MNINTFKERLENYRVNVCKLSTKREMANKLGISEQLYAMVERGDRDPSKKFLKVLTDYSGIPESYWLYGIEEEYIENRNEFSCVKSAVNTLIEEGLIDSSLELDKDTEDILLTALKADIKHLFKKIK